MFIYSTDALSNQNLSCRTALPRAEEFYSCQEDAVPVLHDTAIHLNITRTYDNPVIDLMSDMANDTTETLKVREITNSLVLNPAQIFCHCCDYR